MIFEARKLLVLMEKNGDILGGINGALLLIFGEG